MCVKGENSTRDHQTQTANEAICTQASDFARIHQKYFGQKTAKNDAQAAASQNLDEYLRPRQLKHKKQQL
jgi:hypothetical protein